MTVSGTPALKTSSPTLNSLFAVALALLVPAAGAASGCLEQPYAIDEAKLTLGPKHHPLGRPLPARPDFNQPDGCDGILRFFDENRNGEPDPGEIRLFGVNRQVDCGSCHGESSVAKSAESAGVILRQDAATLCLVCHKL